MQVKVPLIVFYLCDMKKCENCSGRMQDLCRHTSDKTHAKYKDDTGRKFERNGVVVLPGYCEAEYTPPGLIVKVEDDRYEE